MSPRVPKQQMQTIADRVKSNPRVAAKQANQVLMSSNVSEVKPVVKKQVTETVYHRYMLRSLRR